MTNQGKNEDEDEKIWENVFNFQILHISKLAYVVILMKIGEQIFDSFFKRFLTNQGKNKDEDEKICENDFNF